MKKPVFTYWADGAEAFIKKEGICDCCEKPVNEYHVSNSKWWCGWMEYEARQKKVNRKLVNWKLMNRKQSNQKIEIQKRDNYELHLCYDCIASGDAAKKFHLKLNWVVDPSDECEAIGHEEVETRTPSYRRMNKDIWPVHCGEACVYVEGYALDMNLFCHKFCCRRCGKTFSVKEHTDHYYFGP